MTARGYKGNPNKGIWENGRFNKGMRYTNEPIREGVVKSLVNFDINRTGGSLKPRMPYFNSAFTIDGGAPFGLGKNTIQLQPHQDSAKDYFIDIGNHRFNNNSIELGTINTTDFSVYDGDTVYINNRSYRLLGIDAPELTNEEGLYNPYSEGNLSKASLQTIINSFSNNAIVRVTYDKNSNSTIDTYGRPLVWLEIIGDMFNYSFNTTEDIHTPNFYNKYFATIQEMNNFNVQAPNVKAIVTGFDVQKLTTTPQTYNITLSTPELPDRHDVFLALHNYSQFWEDEDPDNWVVRCDSGLGYSYFQITVLSNIKNYYISEEISSQNITMNINREMLKNGRALFFGEFNNINQDPVIVPRYSYVTYEQLYTDRLNAITESLGLFNPEGYNYTPVEIIPKEVGPTIGVYSKPAKTIFDPYQQDEYYLKTPVIDIENNILIDMTQINIDLNIPIQAPITIEMENTLSEKDFNTHIFSNRYMPYVKVNYSEIDGVVFIGKIIYDNEIIYQGIISVNYFVPLDKEFQMYPQFDKAYIKVETYNDNVFNIEFQDLDRYSPNLLDKEELRIESNYGQDAIDKDMLFPEIKTILLKNKEGKFVTDIRFGNRYDIEPIYNQPTLSFENGYTGYAGYAVKFDVFRVTRGITEDVYNMYSTRWIKYDKDDNTVLKKSWRKMGGEGSFAESVFTKLPDNMKGELTKSYTILESYERDLKFIYKKIINSVTEGDIPTYATGTGSYVGFEEPYHEIRNTLPTDLTEYAQGQKILTPRTSYQHSHPWGYYPLTFSGTIYDPLQLSSLQAYKDIFPHYTVNIPYQTYTNIDLMDGYLEEDIYPNSLPPGSVLTISTNYNDITYEKSYWKQVKTWYQHEVVAAVDLTSSTYDISDSFIYNDENPEKYDINFMLKINITDIPSEIQDDVSPFVYYMIQVAVNKLHTKQALFTDSNHGVKVRAYLCPVKSFDSEGYPEDDEMVMDSIASKFTMQTMLYQSKEKELKTFAFGEMLGSVKGISYFNNRYVLYGADNSKNILYLSDPNNLTYFPAKYALDQFDSPVVYVHPYGENLLVFTVSDIYIVFNEPRETEFGDFEDTYYAKKIINNITIEGFAKNSVINVGKYVMFLSGNNIYVLKPNIYVEDPTDLFINPIADAVSELLHNPTSFIVRRHQFYGTTSNIFSSSFKPNIEIKIYTVNNVVSIFMSTYIPELDHIDDGLFMIEIQHDIDMNTWKIYDTKSCAFPGDMDIFDSIEGPHYIMRNHSTINNGGTLMAKTGLNLWEFDEGYGRIFDIKPIKFNNGIAIYNTALINASQNIRDRVKYPIYPYINAGNMYVSPHLNKRFHQVHLDITNIDCLSLPVSLDFGVDGHLRQNSRSATIIQIINDGVGVVTQYQYTEMSEGLSFDTWGLDVSRFGPLQMLRVKFGVSGRGRLPSIEIGFKTTGMFEFYKYSIVYKEQTVR
jgi:hypothetical protein